MKKIDTKSATKASKATSKAATKAVSTAKVKNTGMDKVNYSRKGGEVTELSGEMASKLFEASTRVELPIMLPGVLHVMGKFCTAKNKSTETRISLREAFDFANELAKCPGVSEEVASNMGFALHHLCSVVSVTVPEGMKAVFIPETAYRHLEQMADAMNQDKWAGQDNTAQGVFTNLVFDRDLEDDPAALMDGILEGLDYLPEKLDGRTKEDEKVMDSRKAALTRRSAKIKWA